VLVGFEVQGHAGFGPYGQDIVCAGVSAVTQAALLGLQDILKDGVRFQMRPGYLGVTIEPAEARKPGPRAIMRTLWLGLEAIFRSYPGSLVLEHRDEDRDAG